MAKAMLLSERPHSQTDGIPGASSQPALGNFKGVMLCNRPSELEAKAKEQSGPPPFKSTVTATYCDALGINPTNKTQAEVVEKPKKEALVRHVRWLKQLQSQMNAHRMQAEFEDEEAEKKKENFQAFCERQRESIKNLTEAGDLNREKLAEAVAGKAPVPKKVKPLWAMTESEMKAFEENDAADLIDFAENLDFDHFINDLEFRQAMEVMKDRAGKLAKDQDDFKAALVDSFNQDDDDDAGRRAGGIEIEGSAMGDDVSVVGSLNGARRARKSDKKEWDSSTVMSEDVPVDEDTKSMVDKVLANNPDMKKLHSSKSVLKMIEKAKDQQAGSKDDEVDRGVEKLVAALAAERAPPAPVIYVSPDVETRMNKPVDPSMLPYLYRSPAI